MNKKIILSLSIIAIVGAIVVGGTWAYFSATVTSEGNTFSSGTMEFRIARPYHSPHTIFDVSNLKPGQEEKGYLVVVNDSAENLDMKWKGWVTGFYAEAYSLDRVLEVKITMNPDDYDYTPLTNAGYTIAGPPEYEVTDWTHIHSLSEGNEILTWDHPCKDEAGDPQPFRVNWAGVYKIEVRMSKDAGNDYQGSTFEGDLELFATQCETDL